MASKSARTKNFVQCMWRSHEEGQTHLCAVHTSLHYGGCTQQTRAQGACKVVFRFRCQYALHACTIARVQELAERNRYRSALPVGCYRVCGNFLSRVLHLFFCFCLQLFGFFCLLVTLLVCVYVYVCLYVGAQPVFLLAVIVPLLVVGVLFVDAGIPILLAY